MVYGTLVLCVLLLILAQRDGRVPGRGAQGHPLLYPVVTGQHIGQPLQPLDHPGGPIGLQGKRTAADGADG